ncbi:MAG TPA: isoprenylcysteine carboxylmethyltransferase family protein [Ktedonobacterales bacterium]
MRPLIFMAHGYTIAFAIAVLIWYIPERISAFWLRSARDPGARQQDRGSYFVLIGSIIAGAAVGVPLAVDWTGGAIPWFRPQVTIAGIVLILLGGGLRWWAILTLGRYFTFDVAVRATQKVVQTGPYRLIRHPAYSGTLLSLLGVGLALANWVSLVAILAGVLIGLLYRVRVEEKALIEGLGQPYVDYMRRSKRFIPFMF